MDQSRTGCDCASPICPAVHRPDPPGLFARILIRLGILADAQTSAELAALDAALDAELERFRLRNQAHPMYRYLDGDFDALADIQWEARLLHD